ncbi:hypothetical protein, partial [Streptantibioticus ferralitis]|uniref:hypothetical protein n=1 Tax=Streptantibioticus ferralitis TaxID=236510 RepID=UPI0031DF06C3
MPRRHQPRRSNIPRGKRRLRPIPPPLKRIRRQIHPPRPTPREQRIPRDRDTPHEQLRSRQQEPLQTTLTTAQRPRHHH